MLFGAATSANYALSDLVDWRLAGLLLLGGAGGGALGVFASKTLATRVVLARRGFAIMVLLVALYVAWRALTSS